MAGMPPTDVTTIEKFGKYLLLVLSLHTKV
jgi:hypothetical protein